MPQVQRQKRRFLHALVDRATGVEDLQVFIGPLKAKDLMVCLILDVVELILDVIYSDRVLELSTREARNSIPAEDVVAAIPINVLARERDLVDVAISSAHEKKGLRSKLIEPQRKMTRISNLEY